MGHEPFAPEMVVGELQMKRFLHDGVPVDRTEQNKIDRIAYLMSG